MRIACFGSGEGSLGDPMYDAMEEVGYLLASRGYTVETGGFGGVGMEAPARGARRARAVCVGYVLAGKPANEFISTIVDCTRVDISIERQYGDRLGHLLECDGFVIGAGGGPGTLVELVAAINLNRKLWSPKKRIAILRPTDLKIDGWDERMLDALQRWGCLSDDLRLLIRISWTPTDAVEWVLSNRSSSFSDPATQRF